MTTPTKAAPTKPAVKTNPKPTTPVSGGEEQIRAAGDSSTAAATAPKQVAKTPPVKKPLPAASKTVVGAKINVALAITVDTTSPTLRTALADAPKAEIAALSAYSFEEGADPVNLYNPFRGVSKKDKEAGKTHGKGLIRGGIARVLKMVEEFNEKEIVFVGARGDLLKHIEDLASTLRSNVQSSFGVAPDAEITVSETAGVSAPFSQFLRVESWVNAKATSLDADSPDAPAGITANVFINLIVASPYLYASTEPSKVVTGITSYLEQYLAKAAAETEMDHQIMFGLLFKGADVGNAALHELFGALNESMSVYDVAGLAAQNDDPEADWIPSQDELGKILPDSAGLLYLTVVSSEEEEEGEESEE